MRYEIFDALPNTSDDIYMTQEHMQNIFKLATEVNPDGRISLNDKLAPEFCTCDATAGTLTLKFKTEEWMKNAEEHMHGGMVATICDQTMGLLIRYYKKVKTAVTVHLSVEYMRGVELTGDVTVTAIMEKAGRNVYFLTARVFRSSDGKLAALATAEFM